MTKHLSTADPKRDFHQTKIGYFVLVMAAQMISISSIFGMTEIGSSLLRIRISPVQLKFGV